MNRFTRITSLLVLSLALGCSQPANNENNENNSSMTDMGGGGSEDVDNTGAEYASEYETRIDTLEFTIDPGAKLNGIVATNLNQDLDYPIVVLLEFSNFDVDGGSVDLVGGSGEKTETQGVYTYEEGTNLDPTPGDLDAASGEFSAELEQLDFVATFEFENEVNSSILPIKDLTISGQLALEDGGATARVANGELAGHVTKEDGDNVEILIPGANPVSLTQILGANTLNYDSTTNTQVDAGDGDAWYLEGVFTAIPTEIND